MTVTDHPAEAGQFGVGVVAVVLAPLAGCGHGNRKVVGSSPPRLQV